ncbi:hypothetical protein DNTS_004738 [Danionella cerebrum]|uniref:Coiled-coil domain-containing protein 177 n=1 Tax=Danionella cerebrum TaxID=2873325 RepID=A0A553R5Y3_9TELE|nr:hypothetical protein DNTS_004738 [Danionella translucida]
MHPVGTDPIRPLSPMLHLDLDNFNSPEAEHSRYVLTSPRSLESCARLGVKPVDLLFRTLTDFIDENHQSSLEEVTSLYEEYERKRRAQLSLCREERERILQEDCKKSSVKPFNSLETVLEQKIVKSAECKAKPNTEIDCSVHSKSAISIPDRSPITKSQKCSNNLSLADLRRSPATESHLKRLSQEIKHKLRITIPDRDQKIAGFMLAKHEEEQIRLRQSEFEEQYRQEERRKEEARRAQFEEKRRKELLERIRHWQEDLEERRRRREEQEAMSVVVFFRFKLDTAIREAVERKRYQKKLIRENEQSKVVQREKDLQAAREKSQHASRSKELLEKREKRRLMEENQRELLKRLLIKQKLQEQEHDEKELKRKHLEEKMKRSIQNHAVVLENRVHEMRTRAVREEEQSQLVKKRVQMENKEKLEQMRMLVQRCQHRTERALLQAQETLRRRAEHVRQENQEKETYHRRLQERVMKEEKVQWEERCKALMLKDERREKLQRERDEAHQRSRKVALASEYMRDRVREETIRKMFHQMAREAQLSAQLHQLQV